jgi:hypothetical protein
MILMRKAGNGIRLSEHLDDADESLGWSCFRSARDVEAVLRALTEVKAFYGTGWANDGSACSKL